MIITLKDKSATPGTKIQLPLREQTEDNNELPWREFRVPLLPPRRAQGALSWTSFDPLVDFTWSQDDWSDGAVQPYYREGDARYARADRADLRWEGVAALGMQQLGPGVAVVNTGAESGDTTGWTQGAKATLTSNSGKLFEGTRAFRIVTDGTVAAGDTLMSQDLVDATLSPLAVWQGAGSVTLTVFVRNVAGSSGSIRVYIDDGVSKTTGTSIDETDTTGANGILVTKTISGSATKMEVGIEGASTETGAHTWEIDYFSWAINVLGIPVGFAEYGGNFYTAFEDFVCKYDSTNDVWRVVDIRDGLRASDIVHFNNNIYIAWHADQSYSYGSSTTWTVSTRTTPDDKAKYFTVARNAAGVDALWKSETDTGIANTTDGINGAAAWTTPVNVGSTDREITGLFPAFDTLLVGKEDGLWMYQRFSLSNSVDDDKFLNIAPDFDVAVNTDNFSAGQQWQGWFYARTARQGFIRWRPGEFQDLGVLTNVPRLVNIGGQVTTFANDPHQLFMGVDSAGDNSLNSLQLSGATLKFPHKLWGGATSNINALGVLSDNLHGFILHFVSGNIYLPVPIRWVLPEKTPAPYADNTPALEVAGDFDTSIWHGGFPDTEKAFLSLTIWCKNNLDAEHTIKVRFAVDGVDVDGSSTLVATFNSSGAVQTKFFHDITAPETNAVGRTIQLRFELATDDTVSPELYAFALHSTLRPEKLRTWSVDVVVGKEVAVGLYTQPVAKSKQLTDLNTLENQTYPIILGHKFDEQDTAVEKEETVHLVDVARLGIDNGDEIYRLVLQEANTS